MSLRLLRGEVWASHGRKRLQRATARLVPDAVLDTPALIAHARLVVVGGDSRRLHEEVIAAGGRLREGRFARMNVGEVAAAVALASKVACSERAVGSKRLAPCSSDGSYRSASTTFPFTSIPAKSS